MEKEGDSSSTSSAASNAGPEITIIKPHVPPTPVRQRSSDSARTEPSDDKKGAQHFVNKITNIQIILG